MKQYKIKDTLVFALTALFISLPFLVSLAFAGESVNGLDDSNTIEQATTAGRRETSAPLGNQNLTKSAQIIKLRYEKPKTKTIIAEVSAYSKRETCPNSRCVTASGEQAQRNIAACPRICPFGTIIEIDNERFECGDRLHPRFEGRFDLWFGNDYEAALQFGIQKKTIVIIE